MSDLKNFYSHPGKLLRVHTNNVAKEMSQPIGKIAALFHDLGKINKNFQLGKLKKDPFFNGYSNHAYPSAIVFLSYLKYYGKNILNTELTYQEILTILLLISKHHGSLINPADIFNEEELNRISDFLKTNYDFDAQKFLKELNLKYANFQPFEIFHDFKKFVVELSNKIENPTNFYFDTRILFSELVAADKGDAGNYTKCAFDIKNFSKLHHKELTSYLNSLNEKNITPLNKIRTKIRNIISQKVYKEINFGNRTFTLTVPTGGGKTIILDTIADIIMQQTGPKRCIYSVPFLSITEQIHNVFIKNIYNKCSIHINRIDSKNDSEDVKEISNTFINKFKNFILNKDESEKQKILNRAYSLSTFDFNMIITTFVQFFEAFTTNRNSELMKLHNLKNSIFLIDEIQALPPRLYIFFAAIIDEFCYRYDSYAIFSTATMPCFEFSIDERYSQLKKLFPNYKPPINLISEEIYNESVFNRYKFIDEHFNCNYLSLSNKIISMNESSLIIMNTINDSIEVYNYLKNKTYYEIYLLNTRFHSEDRLKIIQKCKKLLKKKEKVILISTSLIEAGVDIDFPIVFRDIAPLPSLIQSAGRSNREGKLNKLGLLYVFRYHNLNKKGQNVLRAKLIYKGPMKNIFDYYFYHIAKDPINYEEKELVIIQKEYFSFISNNLRCGYWSKNEEDSGLDLIETLENGLFGDLGNFEIVPSGIYGKEYNYYVPNSENDNEYENLRDLCAQQETLNSMEIDLRDKLVNKANINEQLRKMSPRIVTLRLNKDQLRPLSEYDYTVCNIYKAVSYNKEYGLI